MKTPAKIITPHRILTFVVAALVSAYLTALMGCSALEELSKGGPGGVAVTYATMSYIQDAGGAAEQAARAEQVRQTVERVRAIASGESVSVAALKAYAIEQLSPKLSPADRYLAAVIIDAAAVDLERRVGKGQLSPDQLLQVEALLDAIRDASLYFG